MSSDDREMPFGQCPLPISKVEQVLMGHGSGGKLSAQLIENLILPAFRNPELELLDDQAVLSINGSRLAFTTDSYVVTPIFFPGGDIGELAVNGTVNDLAMGGARPLYLSLAFILEEGLLISDLERVVESARRAAERAGVRIVTGDTKVVGKGSGDKVFINTSGIGLVPRGIELSSSRVSPGDAILLSGTIGDHGIAILSRREGLEFEGDCSAIRLRCTSWRLRLCGRVRRFMRCAIRRAADLRRRWSKSPRAAISGSKWTRPRFRYATLCVGHARSWDSIPCWSPTKVSWSLSCPKSTAAECWRLYVRHPLGRDAARIGHVTDSHPGFVILKTPVGGERVLDLPFGEALPRIC